MFQKIKTALLPLSCAIVLSGCADQFKFSPITFDIPSDAVVCDSFPLPPEGPLNCALPSGEPAMCQSEVAIWVETEIKPAYDQCVDAVNFYKNQIGL